MKFKDLTESDINNFISYFNEPHTIRQTAIYFNLNVDTLKSWFKKLGIIDHPVELNKKLKEVQRTATVVNKYRCINVFQLDEVKEKSKQTNVEKYGNACYQKTNEFKQKNKQTLNAKYGVDNPGQILEVKERIKATCLDRYGSECYFTSDKNKKELFKKYGVDNYAKSAECAKKYSQTCLDKYGVKNYSYSKDFAKKRIQRYFYEDNAFDSFPELALYVYAKDHNEPIEREPISLQFSYNNKIHYCFPDFLYQGHLIELKGDQFFNEANEMICPFDRSLDKLFEAKHRCYLVNGVVILRSSDYQKYIDYFNSKYKKENFKNKR